MDFGTEMKHNAMPREDLGPRYSDPEICQCHLGLFTDENIQKLEMVQRRAAVMKQTYC